MDMEIYGKGRKTKILYLIMVILGVTALFNNSVMAEKTVKTIEIPIGYQQETTPNTEYYKTFNFNPPDGISEVISAEVFVDGVYDSNTDVYAYINGQSCSPISIRIPDKNNYRLAFDCSQLITGKGTYNLSYETSKKADNIYAYYKMTYYNRPFIGMTFHGTEYQINDQYGKIFLQLLNDEKESINNATCYSTIYYPNTTKLTNNALLSHVADGFYYYDVSIPDTVGVYMVSAYCNIPETTEVLVHDDFECDDFDCYSSEWLADWVKTGDVDIKNDIIYQGTYSLKIWASDKYAERFFNISGQTVNGFISFYYWMENGADVNDKAYVYYFNGTDYNLLLTIDNIKSDETWRYFSAEIFSTYGVGINGSIKILTSSTNDRDYYFDDIRIYNVTAIDYDVYQIVRGSGEMHVTDVVTDINTTLQNITALSSWNEIKYVGATEYISGETGSIIGQYLSIVAGNPTPVNDAQCNVTIYYPNETIFVNNGNATYISGSNGIYSYDFTVPDTLGVYIVDFVCKDTPKIVYSSNDFHVTDNINNLINQSQISDDVWNHYDRTLTDYNLTEILDYLFGINSSTYYLEGKIDVINYTSWNTWVLLNNLTVGNVTVSAYINLTQLQEAVWNKTSESKINHDLLSLADGVIQQVIPTDTCVDNTTLNHNFNITECLSGVCHNYYRDTTEVCNYGCYENACIPAPQDRTTLILLTILLAGVIMGMIILAYNKMVK